MGWKIQNPKVEGEKNYEPMDFGWKTKTEREL